MNWNEFGLTVAFGEYTFHVSRTTVLDTLIIGSVIFFLVFLYLAFFASKRASRCRWRRMPGGQRPPFTKWVCRDCLEEAFTTDRRPPKECKRILKSTV